ncbi:FAD-binding domain-containing protein [Fomitiporia mediterranea MF3/22]|uniref:FAD-binding domain-containing protein n=1 Tax=Fomitiporia mediterranea (strain MF3/22) TaxID=694068 RepID=UPI00044076EA|nr:FAD-binding domain-containing protein [Fomitiporia mediterranea MF3/22]EJD00218.1 FAD-binding domain-containing protein [Fomitiporia mediterranea MF3/22]
MSSEDIQPLLLELHNALVDTDAVSTHTSDLEAFSQSKYPQYTGVPHALVVHVRTTDEVVKVVRLASKYRVPIVPYSAGTSLEGNVSGNKKSICIDLSRMNQILKINEDDADVVCQAGVVWNELNDWLKAREIPLFFPLDPGVGATIGGMISQGCSGTNAVRYGTARGELILNLTAVLPSGEVIKTRQRARKCAAGFDLTKLFIGAEGTLGIITEATLRLVPRLPVSVSVVSFPNVRSATQAVCEVLNHGATIQCAELVDDLYIRSVKQYGTFPVTWDETDTVLFKLQGSEAVRMDTVKTVETVTHKYGGYGYMHITKEDDVESLWADRKNALFGLLKMYPGSKGFITDVCVPVSKLPDLIVATKQELSVRNLVSPLGGHVGDGNFHCFILYQDNKELELVKEVVDVMIHKAIALEGTCSGEHGIGLGKKDYLTKELGNGTVSLMRAIKASLDPLNLFNPGKLYPD